MSENPEVFDERYLDESQKTLESSKGVIPPIKPESTASSDLTEADIDTAYKTGKPKRITRRGRIIHD